jgi:uncharacterized protein (DUF924 family)
LSADERARWCATPRGALAAIIVLDQFNGSIQRATAAMFQHDELALEMARTLVREARTWMR